MDDFLAASCLKKSLNPAEHFVRVKKRRSTGDSNGSQKYFVPHRADLIETYVSSHGFPDPYSPRWHTAFCLILMTFPSERPLVCMIEVSIICLRLLLATSTSAKADDACSKHRLFVCLNNPDPSFDVSYKSSDRYRDVQFNFDKD